jgi:hypothetical protein
MKKILCIAIAAIWFGSCSTTISDFQSLNFIKFFGGGLTAQGYHMAEVDDGFLLTGFVNTPQFKGQVFVIKTDKAGNTLWSKQYGSPQKEQGVVIKPFNDDVFVLCQSTNDASSLTSSYILRISNKGDSITSFTLGESHYSLIANDFAIDESSIYVVGNSYQNSSVQSDYFLGRYDHAGNPLWAPKTFAASGDQSFIKSFIKPNGNIVAVGTNAGVIGSSNIHIAVAEFSPQGLPVTFINQSTEEDQYFGDALLDENHLIIAKNSLNKGVLTAKLVGYSNTTYQPDWSMESEIDCEAKAIAKDPNGTLSLFGERDAEIHLYQLNSTGNITLSSNEVRSLMGSVSQAIHTSDNGWAFIGTTAPDYGTMMQLIKTDAGLFLFEQ